MSAIEVGNARTSDSLSILKAPARLILFLEPFWLAFTLFAFWYPSPQRDQWMPLLIGIPITMVARFILYRRLWTHFPMDIVFVIFIVLMLFNIRFAPYTRGLIMLGRPLLGMALCLYFVDYARIHGKLDGPLVGTLLMALLVAFLALTGSQWNSKSDQLQVFIGLFAALHPIPAAEGGFNANEIAGALAWLAALTAGLALWSTKARWRWAFAAAFVLLLVALILGQSRFALAGTLVALALMTPLVIARWRGRIIAWAAIGALIIFEIMIVRNVFSPANLSSQVGRDEDSLNTRFDIWQSALDIMHDYPLTGAGLNMFRDERVRRLYPVPTFTQPVLPHTHDELLQFGADMGIPGLALFVAIYGVAGYMLFWSYRHGNRAGQIVAAAVGAGLVAHAFFGLGDAITVWDRFSFLFWWLFALASAQFIALRRTIVPLSP